ncbi:hypothetical protein CCUG62472_00553 [Mycobacteroides salmoniphilum]|nr:hypothetical protein CCUG62472_00553 [Mycobacteroides salmoniphilum]
MIDTCFFGMGRFRPDLVETLAGRLARRNVRLWIPEQVIDEWAIHAYEPLKELWAAHDKLQGLDGIAGKPPAMLAARDIAAHIGQLCRVMPNVEVLALDGQCAVDAIRDQVLGEGAGGRSKDGTRTGAVDASIVRDTLRRVDNDPDRIVYLTKNIKDFKPAVMALGHSDFRSADSTYNLFRELSPPLRPRNSVAAARRLLVDNLLETITEAAPSDDWHGPPPAWIIVDDITVADVDTADEQQFEELIDPQLKLESSATLVGVAGVSLQVIDEDTDLVSYTVMLLADVRVEGSVIDNDGGIGHEWMTTYGIVTAPFDADIVNGELQQPRQSDTAIVRGAQPRFADEWDAYEWVWETVHDLDGITVTSADNDDPSLPTSFDLHGPDGQIIHAEIAGGSIAGAWTLEFTTTDLETIAEVSAEYDPNSRAWLGRDDSFSLYPPTYLRSSIGGGYGPYPALAQVWRYLIDSHNRPELDEDDFS